MAYALSSTIGSILVILLILATYIRLYSIDHFRRNTFCKILVFCLAAIASDMALLLLDGISGGFVYSIRYFFNASYRLFQILSCYYIMVFIDYMIFKRTYRSGKVLRVTYIISGIYAVILILNYIFEVCHVNFIDNIFYKKGYFYIRLIICYGSLLFALGELISYRSLLKRSQVFIFFALPILFILSLTFYFVITTARLNWPFVTTALLYAYFFLVQSYVSVDPLTETGNRLSFNEFTEKLSQTATGESWAIVMIDMDHFKQINDTFGHQEGDNALGYMAEIIKSCVKKDDFVARYGGDEFMLATKVEKDTAENDISKLMNEIKIVINIFNEREVCPFKLEISYGYDVYTADGTQSLAKFLTHIDDLMYKNKNERRRFSDKIQEAAG
jgi:diguanylate cyclase (GGDEF)-like protein